MLVLVLLAVAATALCGGCRAEGDDFARWYNMMIRHGRLGGAMSIHLESCEQRLDFVQSALVGLSRLDIRFPTCDEALAFWSDYEKRKFAELAADPVAMKAYLTERELLSKLYPNVHLTEAACRKSVRDLRARYGWTLEKADFVWCQDEEAHLRRRSYEIEGPLRGLLPLLQAQRDAQKHLLTRISKTTFKPSAECTENVEALVDEYYRMGDWPKRVIELAEKVATYEW